MSRDKKNIIISAIFFGCGFVIGIALSQIFLNANLQEMELDLNVYDAQNQFFYIFLNNLAVCILLICGCGIVTIPLLIYQGFQIGLLLGIWCVSGASYISGIMLLLPHSIVEVPALILTATLGNELFFLGKDYFINKENRIHYFFLKNSKKMIMVLFMLVIAAFVECFITPRIYVRFFYG